MAARNNEHNENYVGDAEMMPVHAPYPVTPIIDRTPGSAYVAEGEIGLKQRNAKPLGEVVVQVKEIGKAFHIGSAADGETITALTNISLCDDPGAFPPIRRGEFVMIRGPSGGGKTTLLNIIGTIDSQTAGTVEILGQPITSKSDDDYLAQLRLEHIGFVFQTFNLVPTMTALENVELPMTLLDKLSEKERRARAKQLLSLVGLRNRTAHLPSELSGGEQQRVTIARALCNNPSILLLDEPTGDLDTATTIEVMDLLAKINTMAGTTMLMVTHNPDVECYADRILYVSDGRFVQQAINMEPTPLVLEEYEAYLKAIEDGVQQKVNPNALSPGASPQAAASPGPQARSPSALDRREDPEE
jgi:putative ABC transport system ATP-binding protein